MRRRIERTLSPYVIGLTLCAGALLASSCNEAPLLSPHETRRAQIIPLQLTDYCWDGGDDFSDDADWALLDGRCDSTAPFAAGDTINLRLSDSQFTQDPTLTGDRLQVYSVWAYYLYGDGYRRETEPNNVGASAGYRLVAWKVLASSDSSLDSLHIKADLPPHSRAVLLQGYIGSCASNPASDSACAYNSVIGATAHDEPTFCIQNPDSQATGAYYDCQTLAQGAHGGISWPQSGGYVNYPPRATFTALADTITACIGASCPSLWRRWTLNPTGTADPEGSTLTADFEVLYLSGYSGFSWSVSSGAGTAWVNPANPPNAPNWALSVTDGNIRHRITGASGFCWTTCTIQ